MTVAKKIKIRFYWWRNRGKLRRPNCLIGSGCRIGTPFRFLCRKQAVVEIGRNLTIIGIGDNPLCQAALATIAVESGAKLRIGDDVGMSSPSIWVMNSLTIGNHVKIGADCLIFDSNCHALDFQLRRKDETDTPAAANAPIVIEDDVLIGARSCILKGVTIGARTVVGSGSIVSCSLPPDCIAAGNPCRIIRKK